MTALQVIGVGSPFADDQLGWHVIDALSDDTQIKSMNSQQIQLIKSDRPGVLLLNHFKESDCVILIDALIKDDSIGKIYQLTKQDILNDQAILSSHAFSLLKTLQLGESLNLLPRQVLVIGMVVNPDYKSLNMSDEIKTRLHELTEVVKKEILKRITFDDQE